MNKTERSVVVSEPNWLLAKYIRHNPVVLLDPSVEAAAVRKSIAAAGPFRSGQDVILTFTEEATEWLVETLRKWIAEDTERDGAFAVAMFCDRLEDCLDALDGAY